VDNFDGFELTGSGCLLNSLNESDDLNPVMKLPSLRPPSEATGDNTQTVPRYIQL